MTANLQVAIIEKQTREQMRNKIQIIEATTPTTDNMSNN